ncbi:MAG TPA: histidine kinase, partial [Gemmatimonadaceae bacterium]|nr:histidine kinase [Gemmatimonadaceae bacterium]
MRTRRVSMLTILAVWSVAALAEFSSTYVWDRIRGASMPLGLAIVRHVTGWYAWALMTPAILWLAQRFPLRRPVRPLAVGVHAVACLAAIALHSAVVTLTFGGKRTFPPIFFDWFPFSFILYWVVIVAWYALDNFQRASTLSAELAKAQLSALRAQLHPHFLFNALNAAVGLVRAREPEEGVRVLTHLSELLRHLLQDAASPEITL